MSGSVTLRAVGSWQSSTPDNCKMQTDSIKIEQLATLFDNTAQATSPEEMLLSAAASCYLLTLRTLLSNRNISVASIELHTEARVINDGGLRFDSIVHRPTMVLERLEDEVRLRRLAAHAEHACMVSCALRGNVTVSVEPTILVQAANH
ncbi:OsmC family protein [Alicyclobacillus curvatus]|jgi:peroxiredoxin-like protein|nr:OsmC family protein [Alicyclobacillus curvatus]